MQLDTAARNSSSGAQRTDSKGKASARPGSSQEDTRTSTVLFWCGSRIWVRCAYCKGQHHFRFKGYDVNTYDMFCRLPSRRYNFVFPASFEIDKEQGWLVNLYPEDTREQAFNRASKTTRGMFLTNMTSLFGQKWVEDAYPSVAARVQQEHAAYESAADGQQAVVSAHSTSLFLRCPNTGTIKYMVEAATLPALNEEGTFRTVAVLKRGPSYPAVMAISGIGKLDSVPSYVLKNEVDRFQRVCDLMKYLDFNSLPAPGNTTAGAAFYATHAEKQLIAYFVYKHVITPEDRARMYTFESRNGNGDRSASNESSAATPAASTSQHPQEAEKKTGKNLEIELPPHALRSAAIVVSQPMCRDCEVFLRRVNLALHINLTVTVSQVTVDA